MATAMMVLLLCAVNLILNEVGLQQLARTPTMMACLVVMRFAVKQPLCSLQMSSTQGSHSSLGTTSPHESHLWSLTA